MLYNKRQFKKTNDKKILHKVKKQWVTISLTLLMAIGGGAVTAHANQSNNSDPQITDQTNASSQYLNGQKDSQNSTNSDNIPNPENLPQHLLPNVPTHRSSVPNPENLKHHSLPDADFLPSGDYGSNNGGSQADRDDAKYSKILRELSRDKARENRRRFSHYEHEESQGIKNDSAYASNLAQDNPENLPYHSLPNVPTHRGSVPNPENLRHHSLPDAYFLPSDDYGSNNGGSHANRSDKKYSKTIKNNEDKEAQANQIDFDNYKRKENHGAVNDDRYFHSLDKLYPKPSYSHALKSYQLPVSLKHGNSIVNYMITGKPDQPVKLPNGDQVIFHIANNHRAYVENVNGRPFTKDDYKKLSNDPIPDSFYHNNVNSYNINPQLHFKYNTGENVANYHNADGNGYLTPNNLGSVTGFPGEIIDVQISQFDGQTGNQYPEFKPDWKYGNGTVIPVVLGEGHNTSSFYNNNQQISNHVYWPKGNTVDMITKKRYSQINFRINTANGTVLNTQSVNGLENSPINIINQFKNGNFGNQNQYKLSDYFNIDVQDSRYTDSKHTNDNLPSNLKLDPGSTDKNHPEEFNIALTPKPVHFHVPVQLVNDDQHHGTQINAFGNKEDAKSGNNDYPNQTNAYLDIWGGLGTTQNFKIFRSNVHCDNGIGNSLDGYQLETDNSKDPLNNRTLISSGNRDIVIGDDGHGNFGPNFYHWTNDNSSNTTVFNPSVVNLTNSNSLLQLEYRDPDTESIYRTWPDMEYNFRYWTVGKHDSNVENEYNNKFVNSQINTDPSTNGYNVAGNDISYNPNDNQNSGNNSDHVAVNYDKWQASVATTATAPKGTIIQMNPWSDSGFKGEDPNNLENDWYMELTDNNQIVRISADNGYDGDAIKTNQGPVLWHGIVGNGFGNDDGANNYKIIKDYKNSGINGFQINTKPNGQKYDSSKNQVFLPNGACVLVNPTNGDYYGYDLSNDCYYDPGNNSKSLNFYNQSDFATFKTSPNQYYLGSINEYAQPQKYHVNFMNSGNHVYTDYYDPNKSDNGIDNTHNDFGISDFQSNNSSLASDSFLQNVANLTAYTNDTINFDKNSGKVTLTSPDNDQIDLGTMPNGRVFDPGFQNDYITYNLLNNPGGSANTPSSDTTWTLGGNGDMTPIDPMGKHNNIDIYTADDHAIGYSNVDFIDAFNGNPIQSEPGRKIVLSPEKMTDSQGNTYYNWTFTSDNLDTYLKQVTDGQRIIQIKKNDQGEITSMVIQPFNNANGFEYVTVINPPIGDTGGTTYVFLANFDPNTDTSDGQLGKVHIHYVDKTGKPIDNGGHDFYVHGLYDYSKPNFPNDTIDSNLGKTVTFYPTSNDKNPNYTVNPNDSKGSSKTFHNGNFWDYNVNGYHELGVQRNKFALDHPYDNNDDDLNNDYWEPLFHDNHKLFGTLPDITIVLDKNPQVQPYYVDYADMNNNQPTLKNLKKIIGLLPIIRKPGIQNTSLGLNSQNQIKINYTQLDNKALDQYEPVEDNLHKGINGENLSSIINIDLSQANSTDIYPIYVTAPDIRVHYRWTDDPNEDILGSEVVHVHNPGPGSKFDIKKYSDSSDPNIIEKYLPKSDDHFVVKSVSHKTDKFSYEPQDVVVNLARTSTAHIEYLGENDNETNQIKQALGKKDAEQSIQLIQDDPVKEYDPLVTLNQHSINGQKMNDLFNIDTIRSRGYKKGNVIALSYEPYDYTIKIYLVSEYQTISNSAVVSDNVNYRLASEISGTPINTSGVSIPTPVNQSVSYYRDRLQNDVTGSNDSYTPWSSNATFTNVATPSLSGWHADISDVNAPSNVSTGTLPQGKSTTVTYYPDSFTQSAGAKDNIYYNNSNGTMSNSSDQINFNRTQNWSSGMLYNSYSATAWSADSANSARDNSLISARNASLNTTLKKSNDDSYMNHASLSSFNSVDAPAYLSSNSEWYSFISSGTVVDSYNNPQNNYQSSVINNLSANATTNFSDILNYIPLSTASMTESASAVDDVTYIYEQNGSRESSSESSQSISLSRPLKYNHFGISVGSWTSNTFASINTSNEFSINGKHYHLVSDSTDVSLPTNSDITSGLSPNSTKYYQDFITYDADNYATNYQYARIPETIYYRFGDSNSSYPMYSSTENIDYMRQAIRDIDTGSETYTQWQTSDSFSLPSSFASIGAYPYSSSFNSSITASSLTDEEVSSASYGIVYYKANPTENTSQTSSAQITVDYDVITPDNPNPSQFSSNVQTIGFTRSAQIDESNANDDQFGSWTAYSNSAKGLSSSAYTPVSQANMERNGINIHALNSISVAQPDLNRFSDFYPRSYTVYYIPDKLNQEIQTATRNEIVHYNFTPSYGDSPYTSEINVHYYRTFMHDQTTGQSEALSPWYRDSSFSPVEIPSVQGYHYSTNGSIPATPASVAPNTTQDYVENVNYIHDSMAQATENIHYHFINQQGSDSSQSTDSTTLKYAKDVYNNSYSVNGSSFNVDNIPQYAQSLADIYGHRYYSLGSSSLPSSIASGTNSTFNEDVYIYPDSTKASNQSTAVQRTIDYKLNGSTASSAINDVAYDRQMIYDTRTRSIVYSTAWSLTNSLATPNSFKSHGWHPVSSNVSKITVDTSKLLPNSTSDIQQEVDYAKNSQAQNDMAIENINFYMNGKLYSTSSTSMSYSRNLYSDNTMNNGVSTGDWTVTGNSFVPNELPSYAQSLADIYGDTHYTISGYMPESLVSGDNHTYNRNVYFESDKIGNRQERTTVQRIIDYMFNNTAVSQAVQNIGYTRNVAYDTFTDDVKSISPWTMDSSVGIPKSYTSSGWTPMSSSIDNPSQSYSANVLQPDSTSNLVSDGVDIVSYEQNANIQSADANETINFYYNNSLITTNHTALHYQRLMTSDDEMPNDTSAGMWTYNGSSFDIANLPSQAQSMADSYGNTHYSISGSMPTSISSGDNNNYTENVYLEPDSAEGHEQYAIVQQHIDYLLNGTQVSEANQDINYIRNVKYDDYNDNVESISPWSQANSVSVPNSYESSGWYASSSNLPTNINSVDINEISDLQPDSTIVNNYEVDYAQKSLGQNANTLETVNYFINGSLASQSSTNLSFGRTITSDDEMQNGKSAGAWAVSGSSISPSTINSIADSMTSSLGYDNYHYAIYGFMPSSVASGTNSAYTTDVNILSDDIKTSDQDTTVQRTIDYVLNGTTVSSAVQDLQYHREAYYNDYTDQPINSYTAWSTADGSMTIPSSFASNGWHVVSSNVSDVNVNLSDFQPNSLSDADDEVSYMPNSSEQSAEVNETVNYYLNGSLNRSSEATMHYSRTLTSDDEMPNDTSYGSWSTNGSLMSSLSVASNIDGYRFNESSGDIPLSVASGTNSNYVEDLYYSSGQPTPPSSSNSSSSSNSNHSNSSSNSSHSGSNSSSPSNSNHSNSSSNSSHSGSNSSSSSNSNHSNSSSNSSHSGSNNSSSSNSNHSNSSSNSSHSGSNNSSSSNSNHSNSSSNSSHSGSNSSSSSNSNHSNSSSNSSHSGSNSSSSSNSNHSNSSSNSSHSGSNSSSSSNSNHSNSSSNSSHSGSNSSSSSNSNHSNSSSNSSHSGSNNSSSSNSNHSNSSSNNSRSGSSSFSSASSDNFIVPSNSSSASSVNNIGHKRSSSVENSVHKHRRPLINHKRKVNRKSQRKIHNLAKHYRTSSQSTGALNHRVPGLDHHSRFNNQNFSKRYAMKNKIRIARRLTRVERNRGKLPRTNDTRSHGGFWAVIMASLSAMLGKLVPLKKRHK